MTSDADDSGGSEGPDNPDDNEVVRVASEAATEVIFSRYSRSEVRDLDVTVQFENDRLAVDIYLDVADDDPQRVVDDAALAAQAAVDDLLE
jgi:hypothetical protein